MTRARLAAWIAAFFLLLAGAVILGGNWYAEPFTPHADSENSLQAIAGADGDMVIDELLDRLGVTRQAAVLDWLAQDNAEESPENPTVWVARNGGHFHGYPLCERIGAPVETTYQSAKAMGYTPCPVCCAELLRAEATEAPYQ